MSTLAVTPPPLVDLAAQHRAIGPEVLTAIAAAFERGDFVLGAAVAEFEASFARFCDAVHCVGVANGTDAIELALRAHRVGAGDEVVLPANSFFATAEAVALTGATPVLVDVDPDHLLIDVEAALDAITPRTRAVLPVHLHGQMAFVEQLRARLPERVVVIEDAAQAQGATRHGRAIGGWGDSAATSFYPGKNLGAAGDAGAVLTNDDAIAASLRRLRNHGSEQKYLHTEIGRNSRLDTIQAIVLSSKLARLDAWNAERRDAAARYDELLATDARVARPLTAPGNEHVFHLYVVRVPRRDELLRELQQAGIGVGIHYPIPLHRQPALAAYVPHDRPFPVTEHAATTMLSLPLYPGIEVEQQELVVDHLLRALGTEGS